MVRCSVLGCKSDTERKIPDLSFHSFPINDNLRLHWIKATGRNNWTPKNSSRICCRHFEKNVLIKKKKLTVLLPNAVPLLECKLNIIRPGASSQVQESMEIDNNLTQPSSNTSPQNDCVKETNAALTATADVHKCRPVNESSSECKINKKFEPKEKIRNINTKLVLFKGQ